MADDAGVQQTPMRALIHSVAHDLAQPLTSIRCFLEVMGMHLDRARAFPADIKSIEQQADRAISLAKGISALVREVPVPSGPWTPLDALLNDVFNDFVVLLHSGLLTLERQWDSSIQVTSSPVLRHLIVLFLSKLVGQEYQTTGAYDFSARRRGPLSHRDEVEAGGQCATCIAGRKEHHRQGTCLYPGTGLFHWRRNVAYRRTLGNPAESAGGNARQQTGHGSLNRDVDLRRTTLPLRRPQLFLSAGHRTRHKKPAAMFPAATCRWSPEESPDGV